MRISIKELDEQAWNLAGKLGKEISISQCQLYKTLYFSKDIIYYPYLIYTLKYFIENLKYSKPNAHPITQKFIYLHIN